MTDASHESPALPILAAGAIGGLTASLFCVCWAASLPAGLVAVRWAARERGGHLAGGSAVGIGVLTGLVLGGITASLGTALFMSFMDPDAMAEAAAMTEAMVGESSEVSLGMAAFTHALIAFFANFLLGIFGAILGAATLPGPESDAIPPAQAYRFEPPEGWRPPETSPSAVDSFDDSSRGMVPPEAFQSAWRSKAASGTPLPARKQSPPPPEGREEAPQDEPEAPTVDSEPPVMDDSPDMSEPPGEKASTTRD